MTDELGDDFELALVRCKLCGALVDELAAHRAWHDRIGDALPAPSSRGPDAVYPPISTR